VKDAQIFIREMIDKSSDLIMVIRLKTPTMVIVTDQDVQMVVFWLKEMLTRVTMIGINKVHAHYLHARNMKDVNKMVYADQMYANMVNIISELIRVH
jgi:hypothetical protein